MPDNTGSFAYRTGEILGSLSANPGCVLMAGLDAADPCTISKNDQMVTINTQVEKGLAVCAESIAPGRSHYPW